MKDCPEPDICKAGDACAGRCKPTQRVVDFDSDKTRLELHRARHSVLNAVPRPEYLTWKTAPANPTSKALKPCRSPYCECDKGKCTHPGFYDARDESPSEYAS